VASVQLAPDGHSAAQILTATMPVPVTALSHFGNTLTAEFSFGDEGQSLNAATVPNLFGAIQKDSTLDLRGIAHFTQLPNLELFADAGFPFTRVPDLSRSAVILPAAATPDEISLYLAVVAAFGARTGYPGTRVGVGTADDISEFRDRHLLVIGDPKDQPLFRRWAGNMPLRFNGDVLELTKSSNPADSVRLWFDSTLRTQGQQLADIIDGSTAPDGVAMEFESPQETGRTVVLLAPHDSRNAESLSAFVIAGTTDGRVSGNISFLTNDRFESFVWNQRPYFFGELGWYQMLVFWVTRYFLVLPALVLLIGTLLAGWMNGWLQRKAALRLRVETT
jgi:cellulose synthase (UDP-forming)